MNPSIRSLCEFLNESVSLYHASAALTRWLEEAGFTFLDEGDSRSALTSTSML